MNAVSKQENVGHMPPYQTPTSPQSQNKISLDVILKQLKNISSFK